MIYSMKKEICHDKSSFCVHGKYLSFPHGGISVPGPSGKKGLSAEFVISSAATSSEEIGNPVHRGTRQILDELGISCSEKRAVQMTRRDYETYDYLLGMDDWNIRQMRRIAGGDPDKKIYQLLDFTGSPREIADPWYTGDFQTAYQDIATGCHAFLSALQRKKLC